ncbi:MAG: hypothetical protein ACP5R5_04755 [Armatimonadota bacterium]
MKAVGFHSAWVLALMIAQLFVAPGARSAALLSPEEMRQLDGGAPGRCAVTTTSCDHPRCFILNHGCKRCETPTQTAQTFCVWFNVRGICNDQPQNIVGCGPKRRGEKCQDVPPYGRVCWGGISSAYPCDIKKAEEGYTECP